MPRPVTAVIPCHNHAAWVWGAVESVAQQDYPDKAVVVVDDGSTDGSFGEVARRLYKPQSGRAEGLRGEPELVVGAVPNNGTRVLALRYPEAKGPSFARNRGIEVGMQAEGFRGDLFALLDSDDLYEPGKLSKSAAVFGRFPAHAGAVYSDYETLRPDGLRVREFKEPFSRQRLMMECIVNCDSLVSRRAVEAVGGFDEEMRVAEDYDLWVRVSERFLIFHVPEALVTVRVGAHSSSATVRKEVWESCWRRVMAKAQARAQQKQGR